MNSKPWPADKIEKWPIGKLIPYARNAREHSEAQVAQIAASIREFGWTMPALAAEDGSLIAGHGRILAARQLGITEIPVMLVTGWTDAQIKAYRIADNKLTENASWNDDFLRLDIADLNEMDFHLSLTGYSVVELYDLLNGANFDPATVGDQGQLDEKLRKVCPRCGYELA